MTELPALAEDRLILESQRFVRAAAAFILFVGAVGLFVEPLSGLLVLLAGGATLGAAFLIGSVQSRVAAGAVLLGAILLFVVRLRHQTGTGLGLMALWVLGGAFSLYATIRYHRARNHQGA